MVSGAERREGKEGGRCNKKKDEGWKEGDEEEEKVREQEEERVIKED